MIDVLARLDFRRRTVGVGARCARCGIGWTAVLFRSRSTTFCFGCLAARQGRSESELHHLGGRRSPFRVLVPVNVHVTLTLVQEAMWRGRWAPGSFDAIRVDLVAFLLVSDAYTKEMTR